MIKVTISNTIFNKISANLLKGAAAIQHMELTHKELKKALYENSAEKAKFFEQDVDAYIKEEKEARAQRFTNMIEKMNTGSAHSVDNKKIRVTSNEEEVTVEFKTEFLSGAIDVLGNIFVDSLKSSAETYLHLRRTKDAIKSFVGEWAEVVPEVGKDTTQEVGEDAPSDVPNELNEADAGTDQVVTNLEGASNGTTMIASNGITLHISKYSTLVKNVAISDEQVFQIPCLEITRNFDRQTYYVPCNKVVRILEAENVDKELQEHHGLPSSILDAIREAFPTVVEYYKQSK